MDENDMDVVSKDAIIETDPYSNVDDEEKNQVDIENYAKRIENALVKLNAIDSDTGKHKYLTTTFESKIPTNIRKFNEPRKHRITFDI
jgi:hypothetical protein